MSLSFFQVSKTKQYLYFSTIEFTQNKSIELFHNEFVQEKKIYFERYGKNYNTVLNLLASIKTYIQFSKDNKYFLPSSLKTKMEYNCGMKPSQTDVKIPKTLTQLNEFFLDAEPYLLNYISDMAKLKSFISPVYAQYNAEKESYKKKLTEEKHKNLSHPNQYNYQIYQEVLKEADIKFPHDLERIFMYNHIAFSQATVKRISKMLNNNEIISLSEQDGADNQNNSNQKLKSYAILLGDKNLWYGEKDYLFTSIHEARLFSSVELAQKRAKKLNHQNFSVVAVEIQMDLNDVHHFGNKGDKMTKMLIEKEKSELTQIVSNSLLENVILSDSKKTKKML